jgi:hypothetical protein
VVNKTLKHCCERRIVVLIHYYLLRTKDCCTYSLNNLLFNVLYPVLFYSLVGILTGFGLDGPSSIPCRDVETSSEVQPTFCPMGTWALFSRVKRPGREDGRSPPITEAKNDAGISPFPRASSWRGT